VYRAKLLLPGLPRPFISRIDFGKGRPTRGRIPSRKLAGDRGERWNIIQIIFCPVHKNHLIILRLKISGLPQRITHIIIAIGKDSGDRSDIRNVGQGIPIKDSNIRLFIDFQGTGF